MKQSIFKEYFLDQPFYDRYADDNSNSVDVIIPVYHTNELWRANLRSIYKEIPVRRLLISDGGVIDDSIDIAKQFPRVEVYDHKKYKTLGKCIAELIKSVTSDWFIYLHSDVYLPEGWFNSMVKYQGEYDWYGCPMNITVMANYKLDEPRRPYAGSQMGRKEAFAKVDIIDDDYVYRQEDFVFNKIVEDSGYKNGKVEDTFHYHQVMFRKSKGLELDILSVSVNIKKSEVELERERIMQIKGIVKYLDPNDEWSKDSFKQNIYNMITNNQINYFTFRGWIKQENKMWLKHYKIHTYLRPVFFASIRNLVARVKKMIN